MGRCLQLCIAFLALCLSARGQYTPGELKNHQLLAWAALLTKLTESCKWGVLSADTAECCLQVLLASAVLQC